MKKIITLLLVGVLLGTPNISKASTRGAGCQPSTWYVSESSSVYFEKHDEIIAYNNTSLVQKSSVTVTRRVYSQVSVGGQSSLNLIKAQLGYNYEVSAGMEKEVSRTFETSIPPHKSVTTIYGSQVVKTSGVVKTENEDCSIGQYRTGATYTIREAVYFNEN